LEITDDEPLVMYAPEYAVKFFDLIGGVDPQVIGNDKKKKTPKMSIIYEGKTCIKTK
jgi:hypothetical protein